MTTSPTLSVEETRYVNPSLENLLPEEYPPIDHLITEDDTPVDNLFSAKQQRLLVEPLYSSWNLLGGPPLFLADANVGLFAAVNRPPLVPDMFLSLGVQSAANWWDKRHRSYFFWEFGKPPEIVIEIVSNREGGEDTTKLNEYARMRISYYVIYDPRRQLSKEPLRIYELVQNRYVRQPEAHELTDIGLRLILWQGSYEGKEETWLRWCQQQGPLIPTGVERAEKE